MEDDLREKPAPAAEYEQGRLQVIGRVKEELELLDKPDLARAHDLAEHPADVVAVALGPSHPLACQAAERRRAFRRRLGVWGVDDFEPASIEPEGQLPILREASTPSNLSEDVGPDHVRRSRNHLERADRLLERALDHVAAGIFGADGLGQPALALVEDVPLIALDRGDLQSQLEWLLGAPILSAVAVPVPVPVAVLLEEV